MFRKSVVGKAGSFLGPQCFISFSFFKLGDSKHDTDFEPVFRTRFYKPGGCVRPDRVLEGGCYVAVGEPSSSYSAAWQATSFYELR